MRTRNLPSTAWANCVRCRYGAAAATAGSGAHRRRTRSASRSDVAVRLDQARRTSMAAERTWLAWWRTALAATAGRARCRPVRPATARRRGLAVHPARLRLRVARGRAVDRRRTTPARARACAANGRPRTAAVPHRRVVHRRRRRARRHYRRARDRAGLTIPAAEAHGAGGAGARDSGRWARRDSNPRPEASKRIPRALTLDSSRRLAARKANRHGHWLPATAWMSEAFLSGSRTFVPRVCHGGGLGSLGLRSQGPRTNSASCPSGCSLPSSWRAADVCARRRSRGRREGRDGQSIQVTDPLLRRFQCSRSPRMARNWLASTTTPSLTRYSNQNSVRIPVLNVPVIVVPKPFLITASGVYVAALPATVPAVPVPALWPRVMVSAWVVAFQVIVDLSAVVDPEKVTVAAGRVTRRPEVDRAEVERARRACYREGVVGDPAVGEGHRHVAERGEALVGEISAPCGAHAWTP